MLHPLLRLRPGSSYRPRIASNELSSLRPASSLAISRPCAARTATHPDPPRRRRKASNDSEQGTDACPPGSLTRREAEDSAVKESTLPPARLPLRARDSVRLKQCEVSGNVQDRRGDEYEPCPVHTYRTFRLIYHLILAPSPSHLPPPPSPPTPFPLFTCCSCLDSLLPCGMQPVLPVPSCCAHALFNVHISHTVHTPRALHFECPTEHPSTRFTPNSRARRGQKKRKNGHIVHVLRYAAT